MRRIALILAALLAPVAMLAQEVVVFKDYRALVVTSHRVQGEWTYLRIGAGEMAVLSSSIQKISNQEQVSQVSSPVPDRPQPAGGPAASPPPEAGRAWRPQPMRGQPNAGMSPIARPAASINPQPPDDDDEGSANSADDNDDEEPPAQPPKMDMTKPGVLKPMQPPGAWPQGNSPQPAPTDTK